MSSTKLNAMALGRGLAPQAGENPAGAVVPLPPAAPGAKVEAEFELRGRRYRVLCTDGLLPMQVSPPGSSRARHLYCNGELVHFQLGEHRFSLVPEAPADTGSTKPSSAGPDPRRVLTNRELQIVQLICMGLLTKQVADRLHLSEFTVRSYLKAIYCKLGVRSRGGMVYAYAQAFGLTPPVAAAGNS